jgi:hypothetical protein
VAISVLVPPHIVNKTKEIHVSLITEVSRPFLSISGTTAACQQARARPTLISYRASADIPVQLEATADKKPNSIFTFEEAECIFYYLLRQCNTWKTKA